MSTEACCAERQKKVKIYHQEKLQKKRERERELGITADDSLEIGRKEREGGKEGMERGSEQASDRVALPQPWGLSGCRA